MKKSVVTGLACVALSLGLVAASCTPNAGVRTIPEVLDYSNETNSYVLEGQKVTLENVVVTGTHGKTLTVQLDSTITTVEVVQKKANPDLKIRTTVNVTGVVRNVNGHACIDDATVEVVDDTRLSVWVTSGMTKMSGFDTYGRTYSGVLAQEVPLQIVSTNGATEYVAGEDLVLTVVYQGEDKTDPWNYIQLYFWGDNDQETIDYVNAFLFGTDVKVEWDDPFNYADSHSEIEAGWPGVTSDPNYVMKGLFHFYYDNVLDPDLCTLFYFDNICVPSLEGFVLYDEESELTSLIDNLNDAYYDGDDTGSAYSGHLLYENYQGATLDRETAEGLDEDSEEFADYLESLTLYQSLEYYFNVCASHFDIISVYYDDDGNADLEVEAFIDDSSSGSTICNQVLFYSKCAYMSFLETGTWTEGDDVLLYTTYNYPWYYGVPALYDMIYYDTSFHADEQQTRTVDSQEITGYTYLMNDNAAIDTLWDSIWAFLGFGYSSSLSYTLTLEDLFYSANGSGYLSTTFSRDTGWYYYTDNEDELFWASFTWKADFTFNETASALDED